MVKFAKKILIASIILVGTFQYTGKEISAQTLNGLYIELGKLQDEVTATDSSISSAKGSIEANKAAIEQATQTIATKQNEITTNQEEIYKLEEEKEIKNGEIKDLLLYYQTNNTVNEELSFVVNSSSLTDTMHRESSVELLTNKSSDKIDEFVGIQNDLTTKNETLATDITDLETMQKEFETQIAEYELTVNDLSEYKVGAADKVSDMKNTISYYEGLGCKKTEDLEACKKRTNNVVPNSSGFVSPMQAGYISSEFGWRWGRLHSGIDMYGNNTSIYAAAPGVIGAVGYDGSRGNYVYVHHTINGQRYSTAYFHMSSRSSVYVGQQVSVDTYLGNMGNTGNSFGAHLHFEILVNWYGLTGYNNSLARNPRNYLSYPAIGVYWQGRNR